MQRHPVLAKHGCCPAHHSADLKLLAGHHLHPVEGSVLADAVLSSAWLLAGAGHADVRDGVLPAAAAVGGMHVLAMAVLLAQIACDEHAANQILYT